MTDKPNMSEAELTRAAEILAQKRGAVLAAVQQCLASNLTEPVLILLYAAVDSMAWLDRPVGREEATRTDFMRWVNEFLLQATTLECTAEDLYSARCGLLHTNTADSKMVRESKARSLSYYRNRSAGVADVVAPLRSPQQGSVRQVDLDALVAAFGGALERFDQACVANANRRAMILQRVWVSYFAEVELVYR